jgi:LETM1 and EF-hand domain-containing protein 1, mitochondrial
VLHRLVPFISIVAILEEILPLVVIYAPFLLPSTCKLPAQAKRIDDLADVKRWDSLVALGGVLALRDGLDKGRVQSQVFGSSAGAGSLPVLGHENGVLEGRLDRLPEGSIPLLCRCVFWSQWFSR